MADWRDKSELVEDEDEVKKQIQQYNLLQSARGELADSTVAGRNARAVVGATSDMIESLGKRAVGAPGEADDANRRNSAIQQAVAERDSETAIPDVVERSLRGAAISGTQAFIGGSTAGPAGMIGLFATNQGNQAYTEAIDSGMSEKEAMAYAGAQAANEAVTTSVFQKFAPGFEGMFGPAGRSAVKRGMVQAVRDYSKATGKAFAQEIPEEFVVEMNSAILEDLSGVDPGSVDPEKLRERSAEMALTTLFSVGGGQAVQQTTQAMQTRSDEPQQPQTQPLPENAPEAPASPQDDVQTQVDRTRGLSDEQRQQVIQSAYDQAGDGRDIEDIIEGMGYLPELMQDQIDAFTPPEPAAQPVPEDLTMDPPAEPTQETVAPSNEPAPIEGEYMRLLAEHDTDPESTGTLERLAEIERQYPDEVTAIEERLAENMEPREEVEPAIEEPDSLPGPDKQARPVSEPAPPGDSGDTLRGPETNPNPDNLVPPVRTTDEGPVQETQPPVDAGSESMGERAWIQSKENTFIAVNKETGESVGEFPIEQRDSLNTEKYEAVSPYDWLTGLNDRNNTEPTDAPVSEDPTVKKPLTVEPEPVVNESLTTDEQPKKQIGQKKASTQKPVEIDPELESRITGLQDVYERQARKDEGGTGTPVGAENINYRWKADAMRSFMQRVKSGVDPATAAEQAKEEARGWIKKHNERRPKDVNWARWDGAADDAIDTALRILSQPKKASDTPQAQSSQDNDVNLPEGAAVPVDSQQEGNRGSGKAEVSGKVTTGRQRLPELRAQTEKQIEQLSKPSDSTYGSMSDENLGSAHGNLRSQVARAKKAAASDDEALSSRGKADLEKFGPKFEQADAELKRRIELARNKARLGAIGRSEQSDKLVMTESESVDVMRQKGDVYVDAGIEPSNGRYPYAPELFKTSDITGKKIRNYVELPDGRTAHPDEIAESRSRGRLSVIPDADAAGDFATSLTAKDLARPKKQIGSKKREPRKKAWEMTFPEYMESRLQYADENDMSREEYLEAYPEDSIRLDYNSKVQDPPRDADINLDVYDQLPEPIQQRWRKFQFGLSEKLGERDAANYEKENAPYREAEDYIAGKLKSYEEARKAKSTQENTQRERKDIANLVLWKSRLTSPRATQAEKDEVLSRLRRRKDFGQPKKQIGSKKKPPKVDRMKQLELDEDASDFIKALLDQKGTRPQADEAFRLYQSNTGVASGREPESSIVTKEKFSELYELFSHGQDKAKKKPPTVLKSAATPDQDGKTMSSKSTVPPKQDEDQSERTRRIIREQSPVRGENDDEPGVTVQSLNKTFSRLFKVTDFIGRMPPGRADGVYKSLFGSRPTTRTIQRPARRAVDIMVLTHEIGHHLDRQTSTASTNQGARSVFFPKKLHKQLRNLDYDKNRATSTKPEQQKVSLAEGWAEFIRIFVTEPTTIDRDTGKPDSGAAAYAPDVLKWFETEWKKKHPDLYDKVIRARAYAQQYNQQSTFKKVRQAIGTNPGTDLSTIEQLKRTGFRVYRNLFKNWVNHKYRLKDFRAAAELSGHDGIMPDDADIRYAMAAHNATTMALHHGVVDIRTLAKISKDGGLYERIGRHLISENETEDALKYGLARHMKFMQRLRKSQGRKEYKGPITQEEADIILEEIGKDPEQAKRFEGVAKEISDYAGELLEMRVRAGSLSREAKDAIDETYRWKDDETGEQEYNYFPMFHITDSAGGSPMKFSRSISNSYGVKGRSEEGTDLPIVDPLEALQRMTLEYYTKAANARMSEIIHDIADKTEVYGESKDGGVAAFAVKVPVQQKLTKGSVEQIAKGLIQSGWINADDLKAARIAGQIRGVVDGKPSNDDMEFLLDRHDLDPDSSQGEIDAAAESEPKIEHQIELWSPDYTDDSGALIKTRIDANGKKSQYKYDKELFELISGMTKPELDVFSRMVKKTLRPFEIAVVSGSVSFGSANAFMDYLGFQGRAKHTKGIHSVTQPISEAAGIAKHRLQTGLETSEENQDSAYIMYDELFGSTMSVLGQSTRTLRKNARKQIGQSIKYADPEKRMRKIWLGISKMIGSPVSTIEAAVALSDMPVRLSEMINAIEQGTNKSGGFKRLKGGKWESLRDGTIVSGLPEDVLIKGAVAAAEASINFQTSGALAYRVNAYLPFFVATINSQYKYARLLKNLPSRALGPKSDDRDQARKTIAFHASTAVATIAYLMMRGDDEEYQEDSDWSKKKEWKVPIGGNTFLRIPKTREEAWVSNAVELAWDKMSGRERESLADFVFEDISNRIPVGGGPVRGTFETGTGYDYWKNRDLEPSYMNKEGWDDRLKFTDNTASFSITASEFLVGDDGKGMSPIEFQHFMNSLTGGYYEDIAKMGEAGVNLQKKMKDGTATWADGPGFDDLPITSRFFTDRHSAQSYHNFFDEYADIERRAQYASSVIESGSLTSDELKEHETTMKESKSKLREMRPYKELMAAIQKQARNEGDPYRYYPQLAGLAREATGKEPFEISPSPFSMEDPPEEIRPLMAELVAKKTGKALEILRRPQTTSSETPIEVLQEEWDMQRESDIDWLEKHKDNPVVQEVIQNTIKGDRFKRLINRKSSHKSNEARKNRAEALRVRNLLTD